MSRLRVVRSDGSTRDGIEVSVPDTLSQARAHAKREAAVHGRAWIMEGPVTLESYRKDASLKSGARKERL